MEYSTGSEGRDGEGDGDRNGDIYKEKREERT